MGYGWIVIKTLLDNHIIAIKSIKLMALFSTLSPFSAFFGEWLKIYACNWPANRSITSQIRSSGRVSALTNDLNDLMMLQALFCC